MFVCPNAVNCWSKVIREAFFWPDPFEDKKEENRVAQRKEKDIKHFFFSCWFQQGNLTRAQEKCSCKIEKNNIGTQATGLYGKWVELSFSLSSLHSCVALMYGLRNKYSSTIHVQYFGSALHFGYKNPSTLAREVK